MPTTRRHASPRRSQQPEVNLAKLSRFLTIDIGGSGLKAAVVGRSGKIIKPRVRVKTPRPCPPTVLLDHLVSLVEPLAPFDCVAVGFPGAIRGGTIITAPNLGTEDLQGFDLATALAKRLDRPVRVANDADIQGLAAITGVGVEMVITLGTGFGAALFDNARSLPNLELGHHPFHKGKTYEEWLGKRGFKKYGRKKWNQLLEKAIDTLRSLVHFDRLYIGGGHARHVRFKLDRDSTIISNKLGVKGGVFLWLGVPRRRRRLRSATRG